MEGWAKCQKAAASAASAVAVALALHGSVALGPALAEQQQPQQAQQLCSSQPVSPACNPPTWGLSLTAGQALVPGKQHQCWHRMRDECRRAVLAAALLQVVVQQQQQQQQQQPQQQCRLPLLAQPLAALAGFFDNADPSDPFTLYGTNL